MKKILALLLISTTLAFGQISTTDSGRPSEETFDTTITGKVHVETFLQSINLGSDIISFLEGKNAGLLNPGESVTVTGRSPVTFNFIDLF